MVDQISPGNPNSCRMMQQQQANPREAAIARVSMADQISPGNPNSCRKQQQANPR
jgi:hypothetical protein